MPRPGIAVAIVGGDDRDCEGAVLARIGGYACAAGAAILLAAAAATRAGQTADGVELAMRTAIDRRAAPAAIAGGASELHALYAPRRYAPLWIDPCGRLTPGARAAIGVVAGAADDGLDPRDYQAGEFVQPAVVDAGFLAFDQAARFDVALSAALLRYLRHLRVGRVAPAAVGVRWPIAADVFDYVGVLRAGAERGRVAEEAARLAPPLPEYAALRTALRRYRALARETWPSLPAPRAPLHPGDDMRASAALVAMLAAVGDLPSGTPAPSDGRYDGALVEGVRRFQLRHGLAADGIIGAATAAALRIAPSRRVRQLELAMERIRWLSASRGGDREDERVIVVNVPMFRLWGWQRSNDALDPGAAAIEMAVIVGRAGRRRTPVCAGPLREVVFRPYWDVPRSILEEEILPLVRGDPGYLSRTHMEIVRGAGDDARAVEPTPEHVDALAGGELRLRQRPGADNALGPIKFVFPNPYDVYLHGTPAQSLFARARRDFSHGCIRVADPVALAEWVLRGQPEGSRTGMLAALGDRPSTRVAVGQPLSVVVFYTTAAVSTRDGRVLFAEDIYGADAAVDRALTAVR